MAKLTRVTQKVFGSTAGIAQLGVFGSFAAGSPAYTTNPAVVQSLSNFLDGWYAGVVGQNSPPIQDMNGVFFLFAYQIAYMLQQGIPEWDPGTTYFIGSIAQDGSGNTFVSTQNNNVNHALTDMSFWSPQSTAPVRTVSASTTLLATDGVVRSNSTSSALTLVLPLISGTPVSKQITIKDVGTGGFTTTVLGNTSDLIDGAGTYATTLGQYDSAVFFNNGTSWDVI